jgi:hypothetical protein
VAHRRERHVGSRSDHAGRGHERRVAARGSRDHRELGREPRRRAAVRRQRRGRVRARCSGSERRSGTSARAARSSA